MFDTLTFGLSLVSGGMLVKGIVNALQEIGENNQRLRDIKNCEKYVKGDREWLGKMKKEERKLVYVEADSLDNVTSNTFSRKYNTINPHTYFPILNERFLSGCCGKDFAFSTRKGKVVVDIRDCSIHKDLIEMKEEKVYLQSAKNASDLSPTQYVSYLLSFRKAASLALVGTLSYDFSSSNWLLVPSFVMRDMGLRVNMSEVQEYFSSLNGAKKGETFIYFLLFFCLLTVNSNRITNFLASVSAFFRGLFSQEKTIQNIEVARTRGSQKLKCRCGKNMEALLGCGHLSQCVDCFKREGVCGVCGKAGRNYSKIFM